MKKATLKGKSGLLVCVLRVAIKSLTLLQGCHCRDSCGGV